jgi:hypothetical protein
MRRKQHGLLFFSLNNTFFGDLFYGQPNKTVLDLRQGGLTAKSTFGTRKAARRLGI